MPTIVEVADLPNRDSNDGLATVVESEDSTRRRASPYLSATPTSGQPMGDAATAPPSPSSVPISAETTPTPAFGVGIEPDSIRSHAIRQFSHPPEQLRDLETQQHSKSPVDRQPPRVCILALCRDLIVYSVVAVALTMSSMILGKCMPLSEHITMLEAIKAGALGGALASPVFFLWLNAILGMVFVAGGAILAFMILSGFHAASGAAGAAILHLDKGEAALTGGIGGMGLYTIIMLFILACLTIQKGVQPL
ncbi:hypothetical protein FISHEDRAFT_68546 [Fistulina hepatica ATCC 64428]|uniref:Uncharacterized protein n=1 Tax=Fistulina hepatica ATCC 64428 TaxID=1128425 RepID=A0A0D7APW8_9AGAR|nr:hypothetical protein FISHEDRAFT_68546 [Fistulina hepatica ATCC 64428]